MFEDAFRHAVVALILVAAALMAVAAGVGYCVGVSIQPTPLVVPGIGEKYGTALALLDEWANEGGQADGRTFVIARLLEGGALEYTVGLMGERPLRMVNGKSTRSCAEAAQEAIAKWRRGKNDI